VKKGWLKKEADGTLTVDGGGGAYLNWHRQWTLHLEIAKKM
jgi:hypothetical protein